MQKLLRAKNNTCDDDSGTGLDLSYLRLFIVSDTPLRSEPFYPANEGNIPDVEHGVMSRVTIGTVDAMLFAISLLLLWSVGDNLYEIYRRDSTSGLSGLENVRQVVGVIIPMITCAMTLAAIIFLRRTVNSVDQRVDGTLPPFERPLLYYIKKIRIAHALMMLRLRIDSLSALTTKIYLNRIRQLG